MTARPVRVTTMRDSDDLMVAGTDDPAAARHAAREHLLHELEEDGWDGPELEDRLTVVDRLEARVGWYRWTPCNENSCYDGGGHRGHLGYADGPGRGVFRGVHLTGGY